MCGRPDATGRSSGKLAGRDRRTYAPPKGEPWVWQTSELLCSPAWRSMSVNTRRLIDFLMVEHRAHAGKENGNLRAPYDQLVAWGLPRSEIRAAVLEAEALAVEEHEGHLQSLDFLRGQLRRVDRHQRVQVGRFTPPEQVGSEQVGRHPEATAREQAIEHGGISASRGRTFLHRWWLLARAN